MKIKSISNRVVLAISLAGLFNIMTFAQDQLQAQEKSEATIELSYYKNADFNKTAVAIIKARNEEGKFVNAVNALVNFYVVNDSEEQLLNSVLTDNKGRAVITLQEDLPLDENLTATIVAKIENDSLYEDTEEQVQYKDAILSINLDPYDTSRLVKAKITEIGKDEEEIPVQDVEVTFYVQRLFGIMPASEDNSTYTDENGETSFDFPKGIPGDTAGVIIVVAMVVDDEQFGNIECKATTSWGTVLAIEKDPFPRTLWEPRAPMQLILTIVILFAGVWGTYFFVFIQLGKIKKEEKRIIKNSMQ